jgi:hypothetical protein
MMGAVRRPLHPGNLKSHHAIEKGESTLGGARHRVFELLDDVELNPIDERVVSNRSSVRRSPA